MIISALRAVLRSVLAIAEVVVLLVVELVAAMLVYIYMNLYHLETFGFLVRLARYVLDALVSQLEFWLPGSANSAYATLIGELGPKSILLLLVGLIVATIIRSTVRAVAKWLAARSGNPRPVLH
ncbi:MAG TPA: hypothetical protein VG900_18670 [Hyphomicrobiaceae bacterium]|jgi:hypothetical protein|nr:hypothetical protein [Hyphomicrobiaceae bacterium]